MLLNTKNRVKMIGLIHEHLYQNEQMAGIDMKAYIKDLIQILLDSLYDGLEPDLNYDLEELTIDIDTSISIGLIINELVTNAIKYAFSKRTLPTLFVSFQEHDKKLWLSIHDNGDGAESECRGFGWTIINAIVDSVQGEVSTKNNNGLQVEVIINEYHSI